MGFAERRAVGVVFAVNGSVSGTFASRLPWIADRLHLSSGMLGAVGLTASIGALAAMPFAAQFVHRYGPRAATRLLIAASSAALALPAFAPGLAVLAGVMLLFGALIGTTDNAMNAQAVEAERRAGTSIMSGLHGLWSIGVLAGALIGSACAHGHVSPRVQFTAVAAVAATSGVLACRWCAGGRPPAGDAAVIPRFAWPHGALLRIGLVGFAAIFVEFAASDWSAVFLHWDLHASQAEAAVATGVFAGAMAAARLGGDRRRPAGRAGPQRACLRCPRHGRVRPGRRVARRGRRAGRVRPDRPGRLGGGAAGIQCGRAGSVRARPLPSPASPP